MHTRTHLEPLHLAAQLPLLFVDSGDAGLQLLRLNLERGGERAHNPFPAREQVIEAWASDSLNSSYTSCDARL
jgi:hypothetical protein